MTGALRITLLLIVGVYLAINLLMYLQQRNLQYSPTRKGLNPHSVGLFGVTQESLVTHDGEDLVAWHAAAQPGKPTILFFHGNAGEIGDRSARMAFYQSHGYGAFFLSYRGFGGSTGSISEPGLITDALTAYDWLAGKGLDAGQIVTVGESLGTGVAVQLAAQRRVSAVALEAPYTATVDIAASIYWWLPVRLLMKDQFRSRDHIADIQAPVLMIHGDADRLIPVDHGHALFGLARETKQMIVLPGAGHDVIHEPSVWAREIAFFEKILGSQ